MTNIVIENFDSIISSSGSGGHDHDTNQLVHYDRNNLRSEDDMFITNNTNKAMQMFNNNDDLMDIYLFIYYNTQIMSYSATDTNIIFFIFKDGRIDIFIDNPLEKLSGIDNYIDDKKSQLLENGTDSINYNKGIYISNARILDIINMIEIFKFNQFADYYIHVTNNPIYSALYSPRKIVVNKYSALNDLLSYDPEKAIKYVNKYPELIPDFIRSTLHIIEYRNIIFELGNKYLDLVSSVNFIINDNMKDYGDHEFNKKRKNFEFKVIRPQFTGTLPLPGQVKDNKIIIYNQDIKYVYYALANVILGQLDELSKDEKTVVLEYLLKADDIEDAKKLRTKIVFDRIGKPMTSETLFDINIDADTIINLVNLLSK